MGLGERLGSALRGATEGLRRKPIETGEPFEMPEGVEECAVYTYDGRPLKGTRKGSKFRMRVINGYVNMTSIYTGGKASDLNKPLTNLCLAYKDKPVGYLSDIPRTLFQELSDLHPNMSVVVRRDGTDPRGWPLLTALVPDYDWFKAQGVTGKKYMY